MRIGNFDLKDKIPAILQKEKKQESFQEEDVPEKLFLRAMPSRNKRKPLPLVGAVL